MIGDTTGSSTDLDNMILPSSLKYLYVSAPDEAVGKLQIKYPNISVSNDLEKIMFNKEL